MDAIYGVILAGGKGERLWPLSRQELPKQLLHISQKSLLEHTKDRLTLCIPESHIFAITTQQQVQNIEPFFTNNSHAVLGEPYAKNTAAAILLSCLHIAKFNPQALILFSPADHYITDRADCIATFKKAFAYSKENRVITLIGIKPTYAATGFGYIEYASGTEIPRIVRFHEKPSAEQAQEYWAMDTMLWNIGIFCAQVSVFIEEYKRLAPEMFALVSEYFATGNSEYYKQVESISIDYALMEKSTNLTVIPATFAWSDVGNLTTFLSLQSAHLQQPLEVNATNNLVYAKNILPVLIGVNDLCIVQTDDVLLIAKRSDVEQVKSAVNELKKQKLERYL